jgi:uncharacterized protein (DUF362 family)
MMILSAGSLANLDEILDRLGLGVALKDSNSVLIKINLARPPEPGHPRTAPALLTKIVHYLSAQGAHCAVAEAANGFLCQNIEQIGLAELVKECHVNVIDLDLEDFDRVLMEDEIHYLPKCLRDYGIRIAIPALSKRPEMIFSNNVKLFVGIIPRCMYQMGEPTTWRPRVHVNLHRSVANIYRAVMEYTPFGFFINGGMMMIEGQGEIEVQEILLGNDAIELDLYQLERLNLEIPEYLARLMGDGSMVGDMS